MIKLIVSDLDGVLLDCKEIHFQALNQALATIDPSFQISPEEHIKTFDGLSTSKKLKLLSELKGFPLSKSYQVNQLKQQFTLSLLKDFTNINYNIKNVISYFKNEGYRFYVASNAVENTVQAVLEKIDVLDLVDYVFSNEDIVNPKPHSEIYLNCMIHAQVNPDEVLIIEDSKHGREAAVKSGAHVCGIDNSFQFTLKNIMNSIASIKHSTVKWMGKTNTNVLIPMAGRGQRFADAGYSLPKPLIDVNGIPMIQKVINNLNIDANYIFVVQKEHYEKYNLNTYLNLMVPNCQIILTDGITQGAACTALLAKELINTQDHLIIANSDQYVEDLNSCDFMYSMISSDCDGGIVTFPASESKWSYAKVENDYVTQVAEKQVISEHATVGIYYYKHGSDFVKYAQQMISKDIRVNSEFYICPIYNQYIEDNKKIKIYPVKKMHGLGTPEDLKKFLA